MAINADIEVTNHGTIFQFTSLTDEGATALRDTCQSEPWQWHGNSLSVDHRMARDLVQYLTNDGLVVV